MDPMLLFLSGMQREIRISYSIMKVVLLVSLLLMGAVNAAFHDERRVPLDEVTIKAKKYGAEATLSVKEDGGLGLTILMNGKQVVIPERALASIKDAWVGTALFSTETPTGVPLTEWKLKGGIILSFSFGDRLYGHHKDGTMYRAGCRIRISADGNYESIETAVPQGDYINKWTAWVQSKDGATIRREIVESVACPLRWIETAR